MEEDEQAAAAAAEKVWDGGSRSRLRRIEHCTLE